MYVSVREGGGMAHNSRQDKFIRYFRLDCAALGQKLRLELANRKLVPRNASRVAEKFHRECSFNCETWKLLFDFSVFFFFSFSLSPPPPPPFPRKREAFD